MKYTEFNIGDIIKNDMSDDLFIVTGVVHDTERLFICFYTRQPVSFESEIKFSEVEIRWVEQQ